MLFDWGETRLRIRQVIQAGRLRIIFIDFDGRRQVRYKRRCLAAL